ncbi:MAG: FAD-binding oxidoreductase [Actinomycetaceae bacterium]|nr:FAD-binding oxidoreductase [Actinomycetaceae bacterium]
MTSLDRESIVSRLIDILGEEKVNTSEKAIKFTSVDRFKKYQSVHGIFNGPFPSAIAYPASPQEVSQVLSFANEHGINVVPRTGGTGTEGGLEVRVENSIVLDGSKMNKILSIDPVNMMATVQCGVKLQDLEDACREQGLTTGNSPQSKPLAQLGGLVATRSIGQLSTLYGAIEDMVVGLEAVFPNGDISKIKSIPRRACGPDIRHIIIGNEGAICFITEVTVKLFRYTPENNRFRGYLVDSMDDGLNVLRQVVTDGFRPSVCRVYSEEDARQHFDHFYKDKCVLLFMAEGPKSIVEATISEIEDAVKAIPHESVDPKLIEDWFNNLNWGLDKILAEQQWMLEKKNLGYTTEVSADWSQVTELYHSVMQRVREEFPRAADLTMLGAHSSHSYQTGTNLYFVYDYNINCDPVDEIDEYHIPINAIVVEEALRLGGSMVHHHGIGKYRTQWTKEEHGSAYPLLKGLKEHFDPKGIMNLGTIYPVES